MTGLVVGVVLAVVVAAFVLAPLFRGAPRNVPRPSSPPSPVGEGRDTPVAAPAPSAAQAVIAPHDRAQLEAEAERMIRAWRGRERRCPACGPRPEPDARYCSNCGKHLAGCPACGAPIVQRDARFCEACGAPVGASVSPAPGA